MKTKKILVGIFTLVTFATFAQHEKSKIAESKTAMTNFRVETENFDELLNFDWNMVDEMFQENDAEQEINLDFAFVNKSEIEKEKVRVANFEMKLTGKTADLDKQTARLKKFIKKLNEIYGQKIMTQ